MCLSSPFQITYISLECGFRLYLDYRLTVLYKCMNWILPWKLHDLEIHSDLRSNKLETGQQRAHINVYFRRNAWKTNNEIKHTWIRNFRKKLLKGWWRKWGDNNKKGIIKVSVVEVELILIAHELYSKKWCLVILSIWHFTCHENDMTRCDRLVRPLHVWCMDSQSGRFSTFWHFMVTGCGENV
jgi:hypothetical protein